MYVIIGERSRNWGLIILLYILHYEDFVRVIQK